MFRILAIANVAMKYGPPEHGSNRKPHNKPKQKVESMLILDLLNDNGDILLAMALLKILGMGE